MFIIGLCRREDKNYDGILELLEVILSTEIESEERERILQKKFGIIMSEEMKGEFETMCNLSQGIREDGRAEERENIILNMYHKNYTLEQIADVTERSVEEAEAIIRNRKSVLV